jgi:hypothetical protein
LQAAAWLVHELVKLRAVTEIRLVMRHGRAWSPR